MADERPTRRRRDEGDSSSPAERRQRAPDRRRPRERALSGAQLARQARNELAEITGLKPEAVTSLERSDDGDTWWVTVELLELSRIPETDDLLGSYEAELDGNGELMSYRRVRRYARSQAQDQQASGGYR
jgi:hypothetical protein